jgi:hypothetical protein
MRFQGLDLYRDPMKPAGFGAPGNEKPGLIDAEGKLRDLSNQVPDITNRHLSDEVLTHLASIGEVRFGPLISLPGKIL